MTVAIPVRNGGEYLDQLLTAIRGQELEEPTEVEIVISDTESTDGSREIAERHGARVIAVAKQDFSHGGTRNLLVEESSGEIVAFLSQDAIPADERWLASILEGFGAAEDVALVFGPHRARPGHSPSITREMEDHFKAWGDGERIDVQRLEQTPDALAAYREFPGRLQFFSDVNGAVARSAWREVPYREVPYAEDQMLGREMIEAGHAKVFHPGAAVIHSHDYPPLKFLQRYFDEYRSLREVLGHVEPAGLRHWLRAIAGLTRSDRDYLRRLGTTGRRLNVATLKAARHHLMRAIGSVLGSRADRLPPRLRELLSLEGRASFEPVDLATSSLTKDERDR